MTEGLLAMIALPVIVALTLRFTSWAEERLLRDELPRQSEKAEARSEREARRN
jgi:hypothetical protein